MRTAAVIQLKWKSYLGDLRTLLQRLRRSEELTDVVLTNGSASMRCHRVILSAACQTFHDLLKDHVGDVVICLGGVDSSDLRSLVDYMYSGEVEVAQGRLSDFLALAAQWGVRGLEETARSASQPTKASGARRSTSEPTAEEDLPRVIEINSSAASLGHVSRRNESLAAESTSRPKGRPRPDDSDSSSSEEETNERVTLPTVAAGGSTSRRQGRSQSTESDSSSEEESRAREPEISILSVTPPNTERKSKKRSTPHSSKSAEPQTSSAQDSANKTKTPKTSKTAKSHHKAARTLMSNMAVVPNMFACPHCPRVFIKPTYFESHLKSQHNDLTHPEQHRLQISAGAGRVVQLAGGMLMNLPSTASNKKKTAQPEEIKKKKTKAQERAAEAEAVADAADAAVRAALERAAEMSRAGLSEKTRASGSAKKAPARDVTAAPAKRAKMMSSSDDSDSDSDSDSSVELTRTGAGKKPPGPVAASTPVTTTTIVRPPPAPVPTPPVVGHPPAPAPPPMLWPQLSHPPPPRIKPLVGIAPLSACDYSSKSSRTVFDRDGQPAPGAAAAPEPQEDVKPIITPLRMTTQGTMARQRRQLHAVKSDSARGTKIVFDQDGRPVPATTTAASPPPPPPPPPVGIATFVRRESIGRWVDPRPAQDRDPAADHGWQRDLDRDKSHGRDMHGDRRDSQDHEDPWLRREHGGHHEHARGRGRRDPIHGGRARGRGRGDPIHNARARGRGRGDPSHGGRGRGDPNHSGRARGRGRGDPSRGGRGRGDPSHGEGPRGYSHSPLLWRRFE